MSVWTNVRCESSGASGGLPRDTTLLQHSISGMGECLDRDKPLFSRVIPVQVKHPDHEKALALTVRVLSGTRPAPHGSGGGQRESVLHVELTDELDPFFLYTLQVGEDDYHQLKHDQRLRVDFKVFPRQFIELLESCSSSAGENSNSSTHKVQGSGQGYFLARLETQVVGGGGHSCFSLVETNHFKELTHLSLLFKSGNDAAIKAYLAARLRQLKAEAEDRGHRLTETEMALLRERDNTKDLSAEVANLRQTRERELRDLRAAHCAEMTSVREDAVRRAEAAAAAVATSVSESAASERASRASLEARLLAAETRRDELAAERPTLETALRRAKERGEMAVAAAELAEKELAKTRAANKLLEAEGFRQEKEIQRLGLNNAALEQNVIDLREMVSKSQALQAGAEGGQGQLAATLDAYKSNVLALQEKLEASVAEINRGNAIIQRIQSEHSALRSKLKLKSDVIRQQERLLGDQRDALIAARGEVATAAAEVKAAQGRAVQAERELAASEGRMEEAGRLIESNQQVITWLNKELNAAHTMGGGALLGLQRPLECDNISMTPLPNVPLPSSSIQGRRTSIPTPATIPVPYTSRLASGGLDKREDTRGVYASDRKKEGLTGTPAIVNTMESTPKTTAKGWFDGDAGFDRRFSSTFSSQQNAATVDRYTSHNTGFNRAAMNEKKLGGGDLKAAVVTPDGFQQSRRPTGTDENGAPMVAAF